MALEEGKRKISYSEMDRLSDEVAVRLERAGLRNEEAVGVMLDRGWGFVVSILGILKAGGSYVPLGVDAPPARLSCWRTAGFAGC